jgi:hypothetical protein
MLEILNSFNSVSPVFLEEIEKETGKKPEEIINSVQGSIAFSINGVSEVKTGKSGETVETEKIPVLVAAMQLNDDQFIKDLIKIARSQEPIVEKNGYYIIRADEVPFYLGVKNKVLILSNEEKYISEILSGGELKNNLLSLDISRVLIDNPICFYLNLDKDSYTTEMNDFLKDEMDERLAFGLEGLGKSLKSLTLIGNIEKTELRVEMKDKSVNSLHLILKAMEL